MKPLDGVRVLDLSRVLAGPWATQTLADLGAEVIKVEQPGSGDDTRHWGPPWHEHDGERVAAYFLAANRGKKSVAIDFSTEEGAALVRAMASAAKAVMTSSALRMPRTISHSEMKLRQPMSLRNQLKRSMKT